jgi:DNA helicase-2/ATP-dependent DNA helicase PcrA
MSSPFFNQIYRGLNPAQKQAVDTIDGPVMVIAGPGTGKTQVLAARIANILLKTDTNPSSVLALTFTESAAKNMRERLVSMIGKTGYYVQIHTFHSFCVEVINSHPEYFPIDRDSQPLSELERYDLFEHLIQELPLQTLKPLNMPYFYVRDIVKSISDLKREGLSVDEFQSIVTAEQTLYEQEQATLTKTEKTRREKLIVKNSELQLLYEKYQERLRTTLRFDFDDMIALVVAAFANHEELLLEYQERLLYFLVDEYQDTNTAQNRVVDVMASYWGEKANIFVVGDPHQAIYRFQGASLENVMSFTERYPLAQTITLETGYRSPQTIYDAAAALIKNNQAAAPGLLKQDALKSVVPDGKKVQLFAAPSQTLESVYVASAIKELLDAGTPAEEIAVLYRNHADADDLKVALTKWGVRYEVDGGQNVLDADHIRQLITLMRVIYAYRQGAEDGDVFEVMLYPWIGLPTALVMKVARAASHAKLSILELASRGYDFFHEHHTAQDVTALDFAQVSQFVERLGVWNAKDAQLTFSAWFELLISESGFLPWVLDQPNKVELLNGVNSLFREVRSLVSSHRDFQLEHFLQVIETLEEHHLPITLEDLNIEQDAVRLSTVHKAKGQEWSHVFLIRCVDGKWGNSQKRELIPLPSGILKHTDLSQKERNEDDRRLFYVAMTRTKATITITHPETIITENRSKEVIASMFLEEIKEFIQVVDTPLATEVITRAEEHVARLLEPAPAQSSSADERAFLQELVKDFKLSPSALNTYLSSPAAFVRQYLLRVPEATPPTLAFGTAVHSALEQWYRQVMAQAEPPSLESVLHSFEAALAKEELRSDEFDRRLNHGQKVLTQYYHERVEQPIEPLYIERFFGMGWSRTMLDDIPLVGRVDRIDWIDKNQKLVRVIDYKTGRPRTLGEIEARTKSAELSEREAQLPEGLRGSYKRQLLFYKLLTELDKTFVPTVAEGVFEFVEPDPQSGKLITRVVPLIDEEVSALKEVIKQVMTEIRSLAFLDTM